MELTEGREANVKNLFSPPPLPGGMPHTLLGCAPRLDTPDQPAHPWYVPHGSSHIRLPVGRFAASAAEKRGNGCSCPVGPSPGRGTSYNSRRGWVLSGELAALQCA